MSFTSDLIFAWRQLNKHRIASVCAILSLGLAIGATTGAFRLVDALLLRPLPVNEPQRLFFVATTFIDSDKRPDYRNDFDYPTFRLYSAIVGSVADVMLVAGAVPLRVTFGEPDESEVIVRQYLSGNVFAVLGLQPALGRLFTPSDDRTPGGHPIAVISHQYWTRRLAQDPGVIGRTLRVGEQQLEIVGVAPKGFTGTEPGSMTDLYVPSMMNAQALNRPGWSWFRIWVRPKTGIEPEQIRQMLDAQFRDDRRRRLDQFAANTPKERIDAYLAEEVRLLPAGSGVSPAQKEFRRPLLIVSALASLVLLIACGNVANLLIARAMSRTREMALRMSIGAGRKRLVQLVLVESAVLGTVASAAGVLFGWWCAPVVVSMLETPDRPVRLVLDADWRAVGFGIALTLAVTLAFGLVPALRASSVRPLGVLKDHGGRESQRRLVNALIGAQMAFCVFVLFAAALFIGTYQRLVNRPLGFTHENVLLLHAESRTKHPPEIWRSVAEQVGRLPGVGSASAAGWAPLSRNRWRAPVLVAGRAPQANSPYFVEVSPGYFETLQIPLIEGRDFRPGDLAPRTSERDAPRNGIGIVNEAFARVYFDGQNPVGRYVRVQQNKNLDSPMEIIGLVRDAAYYDVREPMRPSVYVPLEARDNATVLVRTAGAPPTLSAALRREVMTAQPGFRVDAAEPLSGFVSEQMIRERLLATLSAFFATVALLLAAIGLYGVLNYGVVRQRREIGIRMALGASALRIVRQVTFATLGVVLGGALLGLAAALTFARVVRSLLFEVAPTDPASVLVPMLTLAAASAIAALPATLRAVRIDPAQTLRSE